MHVFMYVSLSVSLSHSNFDPLYFDNCYGRSAAIIRLLHVTFLVRTHQNRDIKLCLSRTKFSAISLCNGSWQLFTPRVLIADQRT